MANAKLYRASLTVLITLKRRTLFLAFKHTLRPLLRVSLYYLQTRTQRVVFFVDLNALDTPKPKDGDAEVELLDRRRC